jgi:hypothetical protein
MTKPRIIAVSELLNFNLDKAVIWTKAKYSPAIQPIISSSICLFPDHPAEYFETWIVLGGGTLIDYAKWYRKNYFPNVKLVVIPTIWGSGAENSPIVVLNTAEGKKEILRGEEYLPDYRIIWPDIAKGIPENLVKFACGDVWTHALEGFLSPLANDYLRSQLGELIKQLMHFSIENNPEWFELSAQACLLQSRSSVGLVHGIAHFLEGILQRKYPDRYFGHAQLCSLFLYPVMSYNFNSSDKAIELFHNVELNPEKILAKINYFFEPGLYSFVLPFLEENWSGIIRDPLTRTNSVLVRPKHLFYFLNKQF